MAEKDSLAVDFDKTGPETSCVEQADEEPEFHVRTWIALIAIYIAKDLSDSKRETWIPNALSLVQAVLALVIASASDAFQFSKTIMVGCSTVSFIGAATAPGSTSIYRVIVAQVLIGFGFATVPLAYTVPSEILPKKWRPMAQTCMNVAAAIGVTTGPLIIGALTKQNAHTGWQYFFASGTLNVPSAIHLYQMATVDTDGPMGSHFSLPNYWLPSAKKKHQPRSSFASPEVEGTLDLPGAALLTTGLTLFLVGLNLGGGLYAWTAAPVLATLVLGLIVLVLFGLYEWKGTQTGILNHDLFRGGKQRGRTFTLCVALIFIEGILLFAYILFHPIMTSFLFETDPFLQTARDVPIWDACAFSTVPYGYASTKLRTIRLPLFVGFLIFTCGMIGLATIEPSDNVSAIIFAGLAGIGFGAPLILIIAGVQLSTPHELIATATAATTSARAVSATVFTAIYSAALNSCLANYIPSYIAKAAIDTGLPSTSVGPFIEALSNNANSTVLESIPGLTTSIIDAGSAALKQAHADGMRVVFIIAAPFGTLALVICFFLGDLTKTMNYHIDAPVEELDFKNHHGTAS